MLLLATINPSQAEKPALLPSKDMLRPGAMAAISADIKFGGGMAKKERNFRSKKSWRLGLLEARSLTL